MISRRRWLAVGKRWPPLLVLGASVGTAVVLIHLGLRVAEAVWAPAGQPVAVAQPMRAASALKAWSTSLKPGIRSK